MQTTRNPRPLTNKNDENSNGSMRLTRAKAANLNVDELAMPSKGGLQSKKTTANASRKRPALEDVSNMAKVEIKDGKKVVGKPTVVSKPSQASGIQKKGTTRAAPLGPKDLNKKTIDRKASGSGTIGVAKRKISDSTAQSEIKENVLEGEPARKKAHAHSSKAKIEVKPEPVAPKQEFRPVSTEHEYPPGVEPLDDDDAEDPLMVAEYANEIFDYLRDLECKSTPNPQYIEHQDELEWKTRGILIDWLIEVHTRFHLLPETLFLAVNIIDRFLSEKVVQLNRLQLVGITAMFIASKYEEVLSPHIANFRHVADDGFTESEILSAERFILSTLGYDLSYPNAMNFLRRISKADNYDIQSRTIGKYLMEISLLDHRLMPYRPSHIAAAAMYLSRLILDRGDWDATIAYYAGYTEEEIEPVCHLMIDYLARPIVHEAFVKKYASKKFLKASILTRQWAKKNAHHYGILDTDLSLDDLSSERDRRPSSRSDY
ncbi:G2/mitotic-specific cyclin-B [Echria macrotheca]|uniref:G2/mitotic-specific cyclin-B n=1 Tax=Echria macrotheca TaxID=438768 RepID=A0AAJ0BKK3_9PEZI|nr:G2/mitotic-specific cyclin-B [Echria macrotheca]